MVSWDECLYILWDGVVGMGITLGWHGMAFDCIDTREAYIIQEQDLGLSIEDPRLYIALRKLYGGTGLLLVYKPTV